MNSASPVELLSPVGHRDCLRAAIENGADAVYFGLNSGWNARARATNFSLDELPEVMQQLHGRGVRGYVTMNTLVFADELVAAERTLIQLCESNVDAILVQDLGLARLAEKVCPQLPVHASTQMSMTSGECIQVAAELNVKRVVLARELSIDEIKEIHAHCDMELEAFVHGALCVAYSGQCLTSESLGGRSANRGQCAQACRLPYELICDGKDVDLGDIKYLLSPQDLAAFELLPRMLEAGVTSFKIEGRLKTPEYVANITRHYRRALDDATNGLPVDISDRDVEEMELSFSRGFSPGWLNGCDHKMLVPGLSSAKRGVLIGTVARAKGRIIQVHLTAGLAAGDGIVFSGDRAADEEQGGRVFSVHRLGRRITKRIESGLIDIRIVNDPIDSSRLYEGQQVWKTDDPALKKRLQKSFHGRPTRKIAVDIRVTAVEGQPLFVEAQTSDSQCWQGSTTESLPTAKRHVVDKEYLRQQLGRLGNSPFELRHLKLKVKGRPMAPGSLLAVIRHQLIDSLKSQLESFPNRPVAQNSLIDIRHDALRHRNDPCSSNAASPRLRVVCRSLDQLEQLIGLEVDDIIADFADIRQYRAAAEIAARSDIALYLATPRIQKPGEMGIFLAMRHHTGVGILVRNLAGLRYFCDAGCPVDADFSLNAANDLTVDLLRQWGARRVTASYDLNREQLFELLGHTEPSDVEVVIHQHMPMFHMEHCVFCAVLSPGTNKTNCGRPCDDHVVQLRDRVGMEHPLTADVGCRNTLFNATPQSAAEAVPQMLQLGVVHFRVELLWDTPAAITRIIHLYRELLVGTIRGGDVWTQLKAVNRVGVTRGTLEERRNPLAIL
jgi:putative protease